ncbi:FkbM family methyltransferase [Rhodovarius crocodyli]|nr:FkbM family methyltransferase [Rhodovarius crocodyli]
MHKLLRASRAVRANLLGTRFVLLGPNYGSLIARNGMLLVTMADDLSVGIGLAHNGAWEPHLGGLLKHLLRPGQHAAEGGANIGWHTLTIADRIGPAGRLHSFEVMPDFHTVLRANLRLNRLVTQVTLHETALWHEEVELTLLQDVSHRGSGHVSQSAANAVYSRSITARATALDAALAGSPPLDLLRLDIEGAEGMALRGARQTIERSPGLNIVMEWLPGMLRHHGDPMEEMRHLARQGFRAWEIIGRPLRLPFTRPFRLEPLDMEALANIDQSDILLSRQDPG